MQLDKTASKMPLILWYISLFIFHRRRFHARNFQQQKESVCRMWKIFIFSITFILHSKNFVLFGILRRLSRLCFPPATRSIAKEQRATSQWGNLIFVLNGRRLDIRYIFYGLLLCVLMCACQSDLSFAKPSEMEMNFGPDEWNRYDNLDIICLRKWKSSIHRHCS